MDETKKRIPKTKPIYDTDLTKPVSDIIEDLRIDLAKVRGQLHDIIREYPGWDDQLSDAKGSITCLLVYLFDVAEQAKKEEKSS